MANIDREKAELKGLLRKAVDFTKAEINTENWIEKEKQWNGLISKMDAAVKNLNKVAT